MPIDSSDGTFVKRKLDMAITIQIDKLDDYEKVTYIGPIDEDAEMHLNRHLSRFGSKIVINFNQVTMVNSCGVRSWINFIRELEQGREVIYEECTPEIVMQFNMIPNFKSNSSIKSVYGGYTCDECGYYKKILFTDGENLPKSEDDFKVVHCEKCSEEMEMEELEEEFFAFCIE